MLISWWLIIIITLECWTCWWQYICYSWRLWWHLITKISDFMFNLFQYSIWIVFYILTSIKHLMNVWTWIVPFFIKRVNRKNSKIIQISFFWISFVSWSETSEYLLGLCDDGLPQERSCHDFSHELIWNDVWAFQQVVLLLQLLNKVKFMRLPFLREFLRLQKLKPFLLWLGDWSVKQNEDLEGKRWFIGQLHVLMVGLMVGKCTFYWFILFDETFVQFFIYFIDFILFLVRKVW